MEELEGMGMGMGRRERAASLERTICSSFVADVEEEEEEVEVSGGGRRKAR